MVSRINCKGGGLVVFLSFFFCLAMLLAPLPSAVYAQGQTQHVVQTGDTLYAIAVRYDTTLDAVRALNGLEESDFIHVGQVLQIPGSDDDVPEADSADTECAAEHTVEPGDSLLALSVRYDVDAGDIARANALADVNHLYIGQILCIPSEGTVPPPPPTSPTTTAAPRPVVAADRTYTVQGGDNLFRIALNHGISLNALLEANGLAENSFIRPGQTLNIPGGGSGPSPAPTPLPTPAAPAGPVPDVSVNAYTAKFFNNTSLSGDPVLTLEEAAPLNKNWGRGAPGPGVATDQFSASFEGRFDFEAATYRFITVVDDGMKLYIDGDLVKDVWRDQPASSYAVDVAMTAGNHTVRLEYYDNQLEASVALRWLKLLAGDPGVAPEPTPAPAAQPTPPPAAAPAATLDFAYGIQAHALGRGNVEPVMNHVDDLGFTWLKQQVRWEDMEPSRGNRRWGELDALLAAADRNDVSVLFSVVTAPSWARGPNADLAVPGPPANPADFADYLGALASRYCGGPLKAVEIWNEQNLHHEWGNLPLNARDYVNLLRTASGAVRNSCPSMFIISGALTPAGDVGTAAVDDFKYMEQMLQAGMANYVDGIGAHPSGYNVPPSVRWQQACGAIQQHGNSFNGACQTPHHSWSFRSTMEGYRDLAVRYDAAALPIVPTEFGWAAGGKYDHRYGYADDNSFQEQAAWTVEAFSMLRNWDWTGPAFLWNLNFRVVANGTERAQWGIVNPDWSPLPVYTALKQMAK